MRTWILIAACGLVSGCAGYSVRKDGQGAGYDVYSPDPYLLRTPLTSSSGEITGFKFEVVWLPNYQRRYRVHSWAGLGKADFTFNYENGWKLTQTIDKSDNSKVLDSLVDLTKHLIPADPFGIASARTGTPGLVPDAGNEGLRTASMTPVLYRIEFDETAGCCVGLRPVGQLPACGQFPPSPVGSASTSRVRFEGERTAPPKPASGDAAR
jgi:hypothetical protein